MNITFVEIAVRFVSLLVVTLSSLFGTVKIEKETIGINNADMMKSSSIVNTVINYDIITKYNPKIPSGITNVITKGQDGIVYLDGMGNKFKTIQEKVDEVVEVGIGKYGQYVGTVTGYGPDCATCDGRGFVACPTDTGKYFSLTTDGIFYQDAIFGNVRILAADQREFPCGTIVEIANGDLQEPIIGVVLDTGYSMKRAYDQGSIHIDLAFQTEVNLAFKTNKNTSFSVKRWGW
jgi:3D (Asp-Asp-Asp) domain-containing protein